jgi:dolichol-phosphate mannosyltransferase
MLSTARHDPYQDPYLDLPAANAASIEKAQAEMIKARGTVVVLPTYNEASNLAPMVESILATGAVDAVLVVDDNSPDGTGRIADGLARDRSEVQVLHRPAKLGLGTAYCAGFDAARAAGFERMITMDADFSHNPGYLGALVEKSVDHDLVIGSRYVAGAGTTDWGLGRRLLSRTANLTTIHVLGMPARDCTSGFRCYHRALLERIDYQSIRSNGYSFLVEALYRCVVAGAASIAEVPILFEGRRHDRSKISRAEILKGVATIARLRLLEPPHRLRAMVAARAVPPSV